MELLKIKSLKPATAADMKAAMAAAESKVELYLNQVDPSLFRAAPLTGGGARIQLVTGCANLEDDEKFRRFFYHVLYDSLQIEIDAKKLTRVQRAKKVFLIGIALSSAILLLMPAARLWKWGVLGFITLLAFGLYQLFQYKVQVEVSRIKRKTDFKILRESPFAKLPALYVIDNQKTFVGANLFDGEEGDCYLVESFEEQVALRTIYRQYAQNGNSIPEDALVSRYLQTLGQ